MLLALDLTLPPEVPMRNVTQLARLDITVAKPKRLAGVTKTVLVQTLGAGVAGVVALHLLVLTMINFAAPDLSLSSYIKAPAHVALITSVGLGLGIWIHWVWQGVFDTNPKE